MSTNPIPPTHRLYPAYCFRSSPTYNAWVKLTAIDVQNLRTDPSFQGQHIYFYLNHPIQFVCLVGVVVAMDDVNSNYTVLTVDDGSGATIDIRIVRCALHSEDSSKHPSNTVISNLNVSSKLGVLEVTVDNQSLDIGMVIKAKCTISEFRQRKQLDLKRIWILMTTNEEVQAWTETAAFKHRVLCKPWHISSAEHKQIKKDIKLEKQHAQQHERSKAKHDKKRIKRQQRIEASQRKEEAMMNGGALI